MVGLLVASSPAIAQSHQPYPATPFANDMYNLLFCDDPSAWRSAPDDEPADWQDVLFGSVQDPARISALAHDSAGESRVRALAFNWLRAHGHETPKGVVLGVIVEVPADKGLDVLAAYADGRVRYINRGGKVAIVEPDAAPKVSRQAMRLLEMAQPVAAQIGPWGKPRLPPPKRPNVRLTFVVSDGLYFGEGPFSAMERDALAGPLIAQATNLLTLTVGEVLEERGR